MRGLTDALNQKYASDVGKSSPSQNLVTSLIYKMGESPIERIVFWQSGLEEFCAQKDGAIARAR